MKTDFEALRAMRDEDIDCSDLPAFTEKELDNAVGFCEIPEDDTENPMLYWYGVTSNAKRAVEAGVNLKPILTLLNEATRTIKSAMA